MGLYLVIGLTETFSFYFSKFGSEFIELGILVVIIKGEILDTINFFAQLNLTNLKLIFYVDWRFCLFKSYVRISIKL